MRNRFLVYTDIPDKNSCSLASCMVFVLLVAAVVFAVRPLLKLITGGGKNA